MRLSRFRLLIATAGLATCALVQAAGSVQLSFVNPDEFGDIGHNRWDRERALRQLREHVQGYAARLDDGQALKVDVLDVGLAGRLRLLRGDEVRVLDGRADWPRIKLRWTLSRGDQVLKSGEDDLADLGYLQSSIGLDRSQPLVYENRMLDRWFAERVAGQTVSR